MLIIEVFVWPCGVGWVGASAFGVIAGHVWVVALIGLKKIIKLN